MSSCSSHLSLLSFAVGEKKVLKRRGGGGTRFQTGGRPTTKEKEGLFFSRIWDPPPSLLPLLWSAPSNPWKKKEEDKRENFLSFLKGLFFPTPKKEWFILPFPPPLLFFFLQIISQFSCSFFVCLWIYPSCAAKDASFLLPLQPPRLSHLEGGLFQRRGGGNF